jgi:hypothetical protein
MLFGEIVAGGGIGLLLGTLLGLSASPVVQGVVVAITALLGALLGFKTSEGTGQTLRIGAFGLLGTAGVLLGLAVRSGSLLAPSVRSEVAAWRAAGYSQQDALTFVAYHRLGIKPAQLLVAEAPEAKEQSNALFADTARSLCGTIALVASPEQKLAIVRKFPAYAALAEAAASTPDPGATLVQELKCGN